MLTIVYVLSPREPKRETVAAAAPVPA